MTHIILFWSINRLCPSLVGLSWSSKVTCTSHRIWNFYQLNSLTFRWDDSLGKTVQCTPVRRGMLGKNICCYTKQWRNSAASELQSAKVSFSWNPRAAALLQYCILDPVLNVVLVAALPPSVLCDPSVEQRTRPDSCQQTTPFSKYWCGHLIAIPMDIKSWTLKLIFRGGKIDNWNFPVLSFGVYWAF